MRKTEKSAAAALKRQKAASRLFDQSRQLQAGAPVAPCGDGLALIHGLHDDSRVDRIVMNHPYAIDERVAAFLNADGKAAPLRDRLREFGRMQGGSGHGNLIHFAPMVAPPHRPKP